ncbi:hypothetical protein ACFWBS_56525, partial [Streptomyces mirabilis]
TAPRRSLIVLLTSLDAAPIEEGLLPVLSSLTQRHPALSAAVTSTRVAVPWRCRVAVLHRPPEHPPGVRHRRQPAGIRPAPAARRTSGGRPAGR